MDNDNANFESTDDNRISQLLSGLKRVGAPNDFDFRVRARIADGKPAAVPAFGIPAAVRYAVPLLLLLAVGAYFGFNAFYSVNSSAVPPVAGSQPFKAAPLLGSPGQDGVIGPVVANTRDEQAVAKSPDGVNSTQRTLPGANISRNPNARTNSPDGGSLDDTSHTNKPIYPRGLDPDSKPKIRSQDFQKAVQVPAKELLSVLGIVASYANSRWKVDAVIEHSVAERSGVKAGDVVEAINDQRIEEKTAFSSGFSGKGLRVLRDGKLVQITLKP
jgi:hypothetical protein